MTQQIDRPLAAVSLAVVGAPFLNADGSNRGFELRLCRQGEPIELRPEPKNEKDENAIAVISARGVQIGYLTAERAPRIKQLIGQGREVRAIFQRASDFGAWIRVAFDGEDPALPPDRTVEPIEPDGGWFPDEVWDDD